MNTPRALGLLLIVTLATPALSGSCESANNGTVIDFGDVISDGPGDYASRLWSDNCQWTLPTPSSPEKHVALEFEGVFHFEGAYDYLCLQAPDSDKCMVFDEIVSRKARASEEFEFDDVSNIRRLCYADPGEETKVHIFSDSNVEYAGFTARVVELSDEECGNLIGGDGFEVRSDPFWRPVDKLWYTIPITVACVVVVCVIAATVYINNTDSTDSYWAKSGVYDEPGPVVTAPPPAYTANAEAAKSETGYPALY